MHRNIPPGKQRSQGKAVFLLEVEQAAFVGEEEALACTAEQKGTSGLYSESSFLLRLTPSYIMPFIPTQPQNDFAVGNTMAEKDLH